MFNKQIIDRWVKEAIKKNYTTDMLRSLLKKNDFNKEELERIINYYELLKKPDLKELNPSYKKDDSLNKAITEFSNLIWKIKKEVGRVVIGQQDVLDDVLCALICNGHVLIEGVPGIAKTLLIKAISKISGCSSKRVQFTADLLPTDITGITTYTPDKGFKIYKGPLFSNFVIADEINRSPPKTQSALLEAMQEKQVTIGRKRYDLPVPFFVLANNNPLESSGVYSLPEAQVDRFLFKLLMGYPNRNEEFEVIENNTNLINFEDYNLKEILDPQTIVKMQELVKKIYVDKKIKNYILNIVFRTRKKDFEMGKYIEWGASPRASIGLFISAKAKALIRGRNYVIPKDVKDVAFQILRHRIILNYRAQAENITTDDVIREILEIT